MIKEAIKKAVEGGYDNTDVIGFGIEESQEKTLLNPLFWQSLGKALGWGICPKNCGLEGCAENPDWLSRWHNFIDHLAEGKDPEEYFNKQLTK